MATADYIISNQSGASFRTDLNNTLAAIVSNNSNSSSPATTYAYQWWADTSAGILKLRNSANNAWIDMLNLDGTFVFDLEDGTASAPSLRFADDTNTGVFSSGADKFNIATGGVERIEFGSSELVVNEDGVNCDFRVEGDGNSSLLHCDAGNDRVGIKTSTPATELSIEGVTKSNVSANDGTTTAIRTENGGTGTTVASYGFASGNSQKASVRAHVLGNGAMMFHNNNDTEKMRITAGGSVGIGTSNPQAVLHTASSAGDNFEGLRIINTHADANAQDTAFIRLGITNTGGEKTTQIAAIQDSNGSNAVSLRFGTNSSGSNNGETEKMRITSDGKVGIGATSLSDKFTIGDGDLKFFNSDEANNHRTTFIEFGNSSNRIESTSNFGSQSSSAYTAGYKFTTKNFTGSAFETVDAMAIMARGTILFQTTSTSNVGIMFFRSATSPYPRVQHGGSGSSFANHTLLEFRSTADGVIGEIKQDGDGTITYATSSDYRLKENIVNLTSGITRLKNLKPRRFNFKKNSSITKDGFLAHELQEVIPEAVNGTKDEVVTEDSKANIPQLAEEEVGNPVYQTADLARVVPLLVAAVQELITKVETLEAA